MASHGVSRAANAAAKEARTGAAREQERRDIEDYKKLVDSVNRKAKEKDFSPELLQETANLLSKNPEYYTIWNIRRRIYANEFESLTQATATGEIIVGSKNDQILQIVQLDLQFLFPLLLKFPKCYWIWNHRLWLLEQSSVYLPVERARSVWEEELKLVGKMLARDSRNFHGWGYRRTVVENLEGPKLNGKSMARQEYEYTTKMIKDNLSNFSAWHNRTQLITRMLDEQNSDDEQRRIMLDGELELIHSALFDPYDQSLWFYHQNLMCTFDPNLASKSMAPALSTENQLEYVEKERVFIKEVLEDADDCKWAYQALIECAVIEEKLRKNITPETRADVSTWLQKLRELDPLRSGRWSDMETNVLQ